jgi:hypothetical protein
MSLLESATAYLAQRLESQTTIDIVYSRIGDFGAESIPLKATRGSTPFEATSEDGIVHRWETRDYLIKAATLTFGVPIDGDTITDGTDTYQVQSIGGQQPYRYSDPGRSIIRVHTKLMDQESEA